MDVLTSIAAFYLVPRWIGRSPDLAAAPAMPVLIRLAIAAAGLALLLLLLPAASS